MAKKILLVVALLIGGLLAFAATQPDTFRVERSTSINAAPAEVYAMVADFHSWAVWSPWEKLDPEMKRTHSGAERGQGAIYEWEGNSDVGKGRMEITEAVEPGKVVTALHFIEPFEAKNTAEFTIEATDGGSKITWAMHGPQPFMSKVIGVFASMDSMIGKDFEAGLANLKAAAEK